MAMIDLQVRDVMWCAQHGHPMLTMQLGGTDRFFAVSMAADDAASLALHPSGSAAVSRTRLYDLVESSITGLGARLLEVQLFVGPDAVLRSVVRISGPAGDVTLPAHFSDGIALAHRRRVPLRMAEEDVARVPGATVTPPQIGPVIPGPNDQGHVHLAPFRDVIDALDLDDL
jgi:bifunctional DNase/RNase